MPSPLKKSFAAEQLRRKKTGMSPGTWILLLIVAIAVITGGYALYSRYIAPSTEDTQITSLAVLPLENLGGDPVQEPFTDGMHDALIAGLSKIGALRVISRTSAMRFRNSEKSLQEIAEELNVDAVVEGSVFRTDNTVRITVHLTGAFPERHIWSNTYDRDLEDVLALYSDVARAIAKEIEITVTSEEKLRLSSTRTVNPEAYDLYMMGNFYREKLQMNTALDYYLQSVEKDSAFAEAYAEIASRYAFEGRMGSIAPGKAYIEAKKAVEKAIELNEQLPGAYNAQAFISMYYEWDWQAAEDNFNKAIEIDPSYITAYTEIDNLLTIQGREQEVLELQRKALEIDPLSLIVMMDIIPILGYLGKYEEAEQVYQKMVEIDSTFMWSYIRVGYIYAAQGKYQEAIAVFTKAQQLSGSSGPNPYIGYVYGLMGKRAEAEKMLAEVQDDFRAERLIRVGFKDFDPTFEHLENLYDEKSPVLVMRLLNCKRTSKDIVADPRWNELIRKMNLPED
ncbi:hypothetical protein ACFL2X_06745 [Candidatus Latescibacterota bacterium]